MALNRRWGLAVLLGVASGPGASAQEALEVLQRLAAPATAAAECERWIGAGEAGAAMLREVLALAQAERTDAATDRDAAAAAAAYALGRLGRTALPAVPELLAAYGHGGTAALRGNAAWALGRVACHAEPDLRARCRQELERQATPDLSPFLLQAALRELDLGPAPATGRLREELRSGAVGAVVAARAVLDGRAAAAAPVVREMVVMLERRGRGEVLPWNMDRSFDPAWEVLAEAAWQAGERGPAVATALLLHPLPAVRLQALEALRTAAEPEREHVLALALRLRDPAPEVRERALAVLAQLGQAALVALPLLHRVRDDDAGPGWRAACDQARQSVVSAARGKLRQADADAVLLALDAALGLAAVEAKLPAGLGEEAARVVEQVLWGLPGCDPGRLVAVDRLLAATDLQGERLGHAILRSCADTVDEAAWHAALRLVATHGRAVLATAQDLEVQLLRAASMGGYPVQGVIEAAAWARCGPAATDEEVAAALGGSDGRLALRALVVVAARGRLLAQGEGLLRGAWAREWGETHLEVGGRWPGAGTHSAAAFGVPGTDVRLAAALALRACGLGGEEAALPAPALAQALGVDAAVAQRLAAEGQPAAHWGELAVRLEGAVIRRLDLPALGR